MGCVEIMERAWTDMELMENVERTVLGPRALENMERVRHDMGPGSGQG